MLNIKKPQNYKKWYIFPNTTLSNLELDDCNDTVHGFCENTKNLTDCIQICEDNKDQCQGGYFIEAPDRNYCVPLKTNTRDPSYPYYRFRDKNIYPQLKNLKSTTFITNDYEYPPKVVNQVFYLDNALFKNPDTGLQLGISKNNRDVILSKADYHNIQLVPTIAVMSNIQNYIPVLNGDLVVINIPNTALILKNSQDGIQWAMRSDFSNPDNIFAMYAKGVDQKNNRPLNYTDQFYFVNKSFGVLSIDGNMLKLVNRSISDIANKDVYFKLEPNVEVYYCENNTCKSIDLSKTEMKKDQAFYNNSPVYRNPFCWGICGEKGNCNWWLVLILIGLLSVIIIFILLNDRA